MNALPNPAKHVNVFRPMKARIDSFVGDFAFMSDFHPSPLEFGGDIYPSVGHAFQAAKTEDTLERARIRAASTPEAVMRVGRGVTLRSNWETVKVGALATLLRQKFADRFLREKLLATGDAELIAASDGGDTFWAVDIHTGEGKNVAGRMLSLVRSELSETHVSGVNAARVVLDASVFRTATASDYQRLADRGFKLSVSLACFNEVWASAYRAQKPDILFHPVLELAPFADASESVALSGANLTAIAGGVVPDVSYCDAMREQRDVQTVWEFLAGAAPAQHLAIVRHGGRKAVGDVDRQRAEFHDKLKQSAVQLRDLASPSSAWTLDQLSAFVATREEMMAPVPHRGVERFNAYHRSYAALYMRAKKDDRYANAPGRQHDAQDIAYLMHVGRPAFLCTADRGLLELVHQSASFQAPWVLTIGELLSDSLPSCLPWGEEAREAAGQWRTRR